MTQLAIKWLFKFPFYRTSVFTPEENKASKICVKNNKENINQLYLPRYVAPNSPDFSPFYNVWGVVHHRVSQMLFRNVNEFKKRLIEF